MSNTRFKADDSQFYWVRIGYVMDALDFALSGLDDGESLPSSDDTPAFLYLDKKLFLRSSYRDVAGFEALLQSALAAIHIQAKEIQYSPLTSSEYTRWRLGCPMGKEGLLSYDYVKAYNADRFAARLALTDVTVEDALADIQRTFEKGCAKNTDVATKLRAAINTLAGCDLAQAGDGSLEKLDTYFDYGY